MGRPVEFPTFAAPKRSSNFESTGTRAIDGDVDEDGDGCNLTFYEWSPSNVRLLCTMRGLLQSSIGVSGRSFFPLYGKVTYLAVTTHGPVVASCGRSTFFLSLLPFWLFVVRLVFRPPASIFFRGVRVFVFSATSRVFHVSNLPTGSV